MLETKRLDKSIPVPLYFQLKNLLVEAIERGDYAVESMIPTEKELSEMFGISRTTVRQAVTEMVREGWLYRVKSKGTFVARLKIKQDFIKRLETFDEQIERTGRRPSTQVLDLCERAMPERVRAYFGVADPGACVYLHRRRFADDEPIVTVETYLPKAACAFLLERDFARESLYAALRADKATRICRVTRVLEAVAATASDAKNLNIRRGTPVQLSGTIGYNAADEPIEYSIARYRGDRNRFEVDLLIEPRD